MPHLGWLALPSFFRKSYAIVKAQCYAFVGYYHAVLGKNTHIAYRRRVLTQLNRIEDRHSLAGMLRFGRKGKLYEQYQEGQEDELNALGLVLNMVVLWTTRYMDAAVNYLKKTGFEVREEDVERLSPLVNHHINFVGKYHFTLPEKVMRGELRPFHNPDDLDNII